MASHPSKIIMGQLLGSYDDSVCLKKQETKINKYTLLTWSYFQVCDNHVYVLTRQVTVTIGLLYCTTLLHCSSIQKPVQWLLCSRVALSVQTDPDRWDDGFLYLPVTSISHNRVLRSFSLLHGCIYIFTLLNYWDQLLLCIFRDWCWR